MKSSTKPNSLPRVAVNTSPVASSRTSDSSKDLPWATTVTKLSYI